MQGRKHESASELTATFTATATDKSAGTATASNNCQGIELLLLMGLLMPQLRIVSVLHYVN